MNELVKDWEHRADKVEASLAELVKITERNIEAHDRIARAADRIRNANNAIARLEAGIAD